MPIISRIGRRHITTRLLVFTIYAVLFAGAVTMVYPFLLMLAGSSKSNADLSESRLVPRFLTGEEALWIKHVEGLFNESLAMMRQVHDSDAPAFRYTDRAEAERRVKDARKQLEAAEAGGKSDPELEKARKALEEAQWALERRLKPPRHVNAAPVVAWRTFLDENPQPHYAYTIGYLWAPVSRGVIPRAMRSIKNELIERFDGDLDRLNREFGTQYRSWGDVFLRSEDYLLRRNKPAGTPFARALRDFKKRQPIESRYYFTPEGAYKELLLKTKYSRKIKTYNKEHGTAYASYKEVHLDRRVPTGPGRTDKEREDWLGFVRKDLNLLWIRATAAAAPAYRAFLRAKYADIAKLNEKYGTTYGRFDDIPLIDEPPGEGLALSDWTAFLQGWADPDAIDKYRVFLKGKYRDIAALNRQYGTAYGSFNDVPFSEKAPKGELAAVDWKAFLQAWKEQTAGKLHVHMLPADTVRIHSTGFLFRDYLKKRYVTVEKANTELGTDFARWLDFTPPQRDMHYLAFKQQTGRLRSEFVVRNYITVWDFMVLHGRGILNTAIYCILAVVGALLVNPLAAYALSRYKPPSAYKVLLFLMLTMAFPPMVTTIPVFLMLRQFSMLNTFWALILPGLASGYSIFLLKGFFDSLPQELYESAALDGAGEFRIFWQITMSLSKPILAVIALGAFKMAYTNFMFALLICQDQQMWTLMVWLFQLRQRSGQGVIFASLIIAAIPTFLIFAFCQNIIMRGIVVPVEK